MEQQVNTSNLANSGAAAQSWSEQASPAEPPGNAGTTGEAFQAADPSQAPPLQPPPSGDIPYAMPYTLPPGYALDPYGRLVFIGQGLRRAANGGVCPVYPEMPPGYGQPFMPGGAPVYAQLTPEQITARQTLMQQRYNQIMQSVQQFAAGEATVSDVVKTVYTNTAEENQMWKGVLVGAAAAILLTSEPVRQAMGKTLGALFPGLGSIQSQTEQETAASAGQATDTMENKEQKI